MIYFIRAPVFRRIFLGVNTLMGTFCRNLLGYCCWFSIKEEECLTFIVDLTLGRS